MSLEEGVEGGADISDRVLREDSNDVHLDVLLPEVRLVAVADEPEAQDGQEDEEQVADLVALVPGVDLAWVRLVAQIVDSAVQPVAIAVNMEFVEVTELIEWVMLQVVHNDLVLLCRLWLILKPVLGHQSGRLERDVILWVHCRVHGFLVICRHASALLVQEHGLHPTFH